MHYIFRSYMRKRLSLVVIMLIALYLIPGQGSPALANELGTNLNHFVVFPMTAAVIVGSSYLLWKYRFSQPPDAVGKLGYHGPGEFYIGAFAGVSLVNSANWSFEPITSPLGLDTQTAAKNVKTDPGPAFGVKAGYFFDRIPYLGIESEGSIASNYRPRQQVTVKPPISNAPVYTEEQGSLFWTMALHIIGRYGFFPTKDVPFGRLQPYIGIGPGVGVIYFQNDSCKNFSLDTEVGLRYMFTKNIAAIIEFKYVKQWDVQLGVQHLTSNGQRFITGGYGEGKNVHFDFDNQKIVL